MTPVTAIITSRVSSSASWCRQAEPSDGEPETVPGRALIALAPIRRDEPAMPQSRRARADFLAHLIATAERLPQTRDKRRAEPEIAIQAYAASRDATRTGGRIAVTA